MKRCRRFAPASCRPLCAAALGSPQSCRTAPSSRTSRDLRQLGITAVLTKASSGVLELLLAHGVPLNELRWPPELRPVGPEADASGELFLDPGGCLSKSCWPGRSGPRLLLWTDLDLDGSMPARPSRLRAMCAGLRQISSQDCLAFGSMAEGLR